MNETERLNLQKMIQANDTTDQTNLIRQLKHSRLISEQVNNLIFLKSKYSRLAQSNPQEFDSMCLSKCRFLFDNYTDIYNKIRKDEISLDILNKLLNILSQIENNELDQHEGSFMVGKYLKELYIDSAVKKADNLDKKHSGNKKVVKEKKPEKITWDQYKKRYLDK